MLKEAQTEKFLLFIMLVRNITTKVNTATLCLPERSRRPVFASTPLSRTSKNIACGNVADHHIIY